MSLIQQIDRLIEGRSLLDHSFYTKWAAGTLPRASLQEYARQYYAFESRFPTFLSALHSRSERADVRQSLLENLWDEEHGESNHAELWLRFAEGVGVERDDVRSAEPNEATRHLLDTYGTITREAPVPAGIAAVYAYERQVPGVSVSKIDGLRRYYGLEDGPALTFFEVHGVLDVEHSQAEARMVEDLAVGDDHAPILAATEQALDAWWGFLDAVDPDDEDEAAA